MVQGECEQRIEVLVKIKKKIGGGSRGGSVWGGQGRCEQRSEFFVKIPKKKNWWGGGSGPGWVGVTG